MRILILVLVIAFAIWIIVNCARAVERNRRQEKLEKLGIRLAIEREIQKANDVAERLYQP